MRTKKKPDFSEAGTILRDDFFASDLKQQLIDHLTRSPLSPEQKNSLLSFCSDMAQSLDGSTEATDVQRAQIEAIAANARRLLSSLSVIGPPAKQFLAAHTDYLAFGTNPPVELNNVVKDALRSEAGLLSTAWDWVTALEDSANYAASKYQISRQTKPDQIRAKQYLTLIVQHIRHLTGKLPPKDQSTWFAGFAECLCASLGMPAGKKIIAAALAAPL